MSETRSGDPDLPPLTLAWTEEALGDLLRLPVEARKAAARSIEAWAVTHGHSEVGPAVVAEARRARDRAEAEGVVRRGAGPHGGPHAPGQGGAFPDPARDEAEAPRQFVTFAFYRIDPAWRRLDRRDRDRHKEELAGVYERWAGGGKVICRSYSTVGTRADADLALWRIAYDLGHIQDMSGEIARTGLGGWLETTHNLVGMTRRSSYVDKIDPEHDTSRLRIVPGRAKYLFVYPFVKTRDWYLLRPHARQGIMDEHVFVGSKYGRVKLNTTYSFGLDDQDFVVAFESNYPQDFVDLVMELRETESSRYTVRDTPTFTCIARPLREALDLLGG